MPPKVRKAAELMFVGAGLAVFGGIVLIVRATAIRNGLIQDYPKDSAAQINSLLTTAKVSGIVLGLIEAGLWIWMAFACRAGQAYARILSTIFFAIGCLPLFEDIGILTSTNHAPSSGGIFGGTSSLLAAIVAIAAWLCGLLAIVLLWNKESSKYFS
jgi:hypothetical protein